MPRNPDIKSVMVIGSGPIVIGQAAEFDYSGTQACRVLREEGIRVILVNSNPATIMTDPEFADATYIEPITPEVVASIIEKERPDALLPTLGGQTALNTAVALHENGVLDKYQVELIGAKVEAIRSGEDRDEFKHVVERCGGEVARSFIVHSLEECKQAAQELGYPLVVRPSFTMGGLGSGLAHDEAELLQFVEAGLHASPTNEVLLEESLLGWKEFELEMMRDKNDNVVVICSIENVDPVGVHTGDSVTVAPAMTLTDREYQHLRDLGIAVIREVGVDTGGCNIQFAVHPQTGRVVIIEMNPRVSRSSALASKATGFPIAKIATRLAVGYTLDEIPNEITGSTPASFEPTLDYVVVKVPRFAFEKFQAADTTLTTTMKSVGEAMAIGRNYTEALNKAWRSIDKKGVGFHWEGKAPDAAETKALVEAAQAPTELRIQQLQQAIRGGATTAQLHEATAIDPWFLEQMQILEQVAQQVRAAKTLTRDVLALAKHHGFSDRQIAGIRGIAEESVREVRFAYGLHPVFKMVDTCAGEFEARTPYYYSSYDQENEIMPRERPAVIILGSGPNRIGQGIEFDYSCVHATMALADKYETIMVNCNPETVSTDYDTADRLYFEPVTFEDVYEVYLAECEAGPVAGVIVQLGGQTPLSLARQLEAAGVPILGTSPTAIDAAEDRGIFAHLLEENDLLAPTNGMVHSTKEALALAAQITYPVLARPSYVLGGRGMEIVFDPQQMAEYMAHQLAEAGRSSAQTLRHPILIDKFLDEAIEIDVDAIYDGKEMFLGGVMEHIEEAGIHSGDSACVLPPATLSSREIERIRESTERIAAAVGVRGLLNVQFAIAGDTLYVLEANPRASRTVPFVAKATGVPIAKAATLVMEGNTLAELRETGVLPEADASTLVPGVPIAVKEAVLPFRRFRTKEGQSVDNVLGPEMRSTGEVMGLDMNIPMAFAKSQAGAYGGGLPTAGSVLVSVADRYKRSVVFPTLQLAEMGFKILATRGTAEVLRRYNIDVEIVANTLYEAEPGERGVVELIEAGEIDMVVNTPHGAGSRIAGHEIRAAATASDVSIITTMRQFQLAVLAIEAQRAQKSFSVRSTQEHNRERAELISESRR